MMAALDLDMSYVAIAAVKANSAAESSVLSSSSFWRCVIVTVFQLWRVKPGKENIFKPISAMRRARPALISPSRPRGALAGRAEAGSGRTDGEHRQMANRQSAAYGVSFVACAAPRRIIVERPFLTRMKWRVSIADIISLSPCLASNCRPPELYHRHDWCVARPTILPSARAS